MKQNNRFFHFFIPIFIQIGVICISMVLHRLFIGRGEFVCPQTTIGESITLPTMGRMVYMIIATVLFIVTSYFASKYAKLDRTYLPFILGMFSGTFLWQSIGEDCWHFSIDGTNLVQLETVSVLPLFILYVLFLIYLFKKCKLNWGVWCTIMAFSVNWGGHYVLEGFAPIFAGIISPNTYMKIVGLGLGSVILVFSIVKGLKKDSPEKLRIQASVLFFFAMAIIAFSFIEGA